jgi:biopolymer transport protein ExbB
LILLSIIQAAGWPIWPLIACSIFALAIILERLYALQTTKVLPEHALQRAIDSTQQGFQASPAFKRSPKWVPLDLFLPAVYKHFL